LYYPLIKQFNKFSKQNKLNINVHLNLFSDANSTTLVSDYESLLEASFKMNKKFEYDIIFYDNVYTTRFGQHLANLKGLIPDEHIDLYKPGIASRSCVYGKDKWVGLVIYNKF